MEVNYSDLKQFILEQIAFYKTDKKKREEWEKKLKLLKREMEREINSWYEENK